MANRYLGRFIAVLHFVPKIISSCIARTCNQRFVSWGIMTYPKSLSDIHPKSLSGIHPKSLSDIHIHPKSLSDIRKIFRISERTFSAITTCRATCLYVRNKKYFGFLKSMLRISYFGYPKACRIWDLLWRFAYCKHRVLLSFWHNFTHPWKFANEKNIGILRKKLRNLLDTRDSEISNDSQALNGYSDILWSELYFSPHILIVSHILNERSYINLTSETERFWKYR